MCCVVVLLLCCCVVVLLCCCVVVLLCCCVLVVVVVVSDAYESVCMCTTLQPCYSCKLFFIKKRANLETWACTKTQGFTQPQS